MMTVKKLCALAGVSGWEDAVRDYIAEAAEPYADSIKTDKLGNLTVRVNGTGSGSVMLAVHMDEVGLLVSGIDDGYLKFVTAGGIDRRVLPGKRVIVNGRVGVVGMKAVHLSKPDERKKVPDFESMYIDMGFLDSEEAEKFVKLGDFAVFEPKQYEFGELFASKAIDDRVGCGVLLELMKKRRKPTVDYVFTVQEEIGTRGAFGAAFGLSLDFAIVVEGTTCADIPGVDNKVCVPGGGVVIPFMDGGAVYDLFGRLTACADRHGIAWQTKTLPVGGTDASAIQRTGSGCQVGCLALATRYIHAPISVADLREVGEIVKLADLFLEEGFL